MVREPYCATYSPLIRLLTTFGSAKGTDRPASGTTTENTRPCSDVIEYEIPRQARNDKRETKLGMTVKILGTGSALRNDSLEDVRI
jgi:hypothetical protein